MVFKEANKICACERCVFPDDNSVTIVGMELVLVGMGKLEKVTILLEMVSIIFCGLNALCIGNVELSKLFNAKCRVDVGHAYVVTDIFKDVALVIVFKMAIRIEEAWFSFICNHQASKFTEGAECCFEIFIVGENNASFAGGHVVCDKKAICGEEPVGAYFFSIECGAVCLAAVF